MIIKSGIQSFYRVSVEGPDKLAANPEWEREVLWCTRRATESGSETIDGVHTEWGMFDTIHDAEHARECLVRVFGRAGQ